MTDVNGNSSTCTATVIVEENIPPTALCQDLTIYLDAQGEASITAQDVDAGSFLTTVSLTRSTLLQMRLLAPELELIQLY